jgi:large subunit ribosomal protein L3
MPKAHMPRSGSMQYWPRKRAKRAYARVRSWAAGKEPKLMGFAGYKAGMSHISFTDPRKSSTTKGMEITWPVTVIECPPVKVFSVRFYKKTSYGITLATEVASKPDKELARKTITPKSIKKKLEGLKPEDYDDIRLLVYTQPKLTGIGKKKPEMLEMAIGGSIQERFDFAKANLGKEISVEDVFAEGQQLEAHAITRGKGFQGALKRFGIGKKAHKSEKGTRTPGSLGPWCGQGHIMYRVAHAGKMGFHTRTEYNKVIMKIGKEPKEINPKDGFIGYGMVKSPYLLIKGSVQGPAKRIIRLNQSIRPNKKLEMPVPEISYVSVASKQGR